MSADDIIERTRDELISFDTLRGRLERTEPVRSELFTVGDSIRFEADPSWNHGVNAKTGDDTVGVFATLGGPVHQRRLQLTRSTLEELCGNFGFRRDYVAECPAELLVPHINHWYREGLLNRSRKPKDYQFIVNDQSHAIAFAKQGSQPLSNLRLLEQAGDAIGQRYGNVEILADYKLNHTLRATTMRLIIPNAYQVLHDTGEDGDVWSVGVQIRNSLTGQSQTSVEGYLFRWLHTSGLIDARAASGAVTRRKDATEDEVYAWAREAVDEAIVGLAGSLDGVQSLTGLGIEGSVSDTLRDVFEHYRISLPLRSKIISRVSDYDGEITMYVIMNAITETANEPELEPSAVETLMRVGGDLPYTAEQRCGACHRLLHQH